MLSKRSRLNLEDKEKWIQFFFSECIKDSEFLKNFHNDRNKKDILEKVAGEVLIFTCDKETRLKFSQHKDLIEKLLIDFELITTDGKGEKIINRNVIISYQDFCDKMAENGVIMNSEEARGVLGEYHIAAFYPSCDYNYFIANNSLSNVCKTITKDTLEIIKNQLLKIIEDDDGPKTSAKLTEAFLKNYFIFMEPSGLKTMIDMGGIPGYIKGQEPSKIEQIKNNTLIQKAKMIASTTDLQEDSQIILHRPSCSHKEEEIGSIFFKTYMNDKEINSEYFSDLKDKYGLSIKHIKGKMLENIKHEIDSFICSKETRLKFQNYKDKIEETLIKFNIIFLNANGKKYLNYGQFVSYQDFCNEMAKKGVVMNLEEARGVLGEYHIAAFYPYFNYDYVIVKDILSGIFMATPVRNSNDCEKELLQAYENYRDQEYKGPRKYAKMIIQVKIIESFLKKYFVVSKFHILKRKIYRAYLQEYATRQQTRYASLEDIEGKISNEFFGSESLQIDSIEPFSRCDNRFFNQRPLQMEQQFPLPYETINPESNFSTDRPVSLYSQQKPLSSSNLSEKEKVIQYLFMARINDKKPNLKFLKDLQDKYGISYKRIRKIMTEDVNPEIYFFTCNRETRLKFLQYKYEIEEVLMDLNIISLDTNGRKCLKNRRFIRYQDFCNEMAKKGVVMNLEEARGVLGEYHIAAFFPSFNYDYVIVKNGFKRILEDNDDLRGTREIILQFIKKYKTFGRITDNTAIVKELFEEYFIVITPSNLKNMILYYKRLEKGKMNQTTSISTQSIEYNISNKLFSQELPQTEPTPDISGHNSVAQKPDDPSNQEELQTEPQQHPLYESPISQYHLSSEISRPYYNDVESFFTASRLSEMQKCSTAILKKSPENDGGFIIRNQSLLYEQMEKQQQQRLQNLLNRNLRIEPANERTRQVKMNKPQKKSNNRRGSR